MNSKLTSLKGSPRIVTVFGCHNNQLTSLEYCPRIVNRGFYFENNQITELINLPEYIGGSIYYHQNPIAEKIDQYGIKTVLLQEKLARINKKLTTKTCV